MKKTLNKEKIRGARRKTVACFSRLEKLTNEFPVSCTDRYDHYHMPCSNMLLDSPKTPAYTKSKCIKTIVKQLEKLRDTRPDEMNAARLVAVITTKLSRAQIVIFFDESYYQGFFERDNESQKWTLLDDIKAEKFLKNWGVDLPENMKIKGYQEELEDDDFSCKSKIWFIGEL